MKKLQPIGIFDSGIGGLTVAKAINTLLPNESIIYFGDTAHSPYGNQSAAAIRHYATKISETLLAQKCKLIVIACNSASAAAFAEVQHVVQDQAQVLNVIDPVIDHLTTNYANKSIGLIGTKQTIKSAAYATRLAARAPSIKLASLATPLLAPIIEEGFADSNAAQEILTHYLSDPKFADISALILGCTHYPLIKSQINEFFKNKIEVLDSATLIAQHVRATLQQNDLLNEFAETFATFYVSHDSQFFNQTAQRFFPGDIKLETYPLWD